MTAIWAFFKIFLANVSIMLTITYAARIVHKYLLAFRSVRLNRWLFIGTAIFAGVTSISFGARIDASIFDLRFVPLFACAIMLRGAFPMLVIGWGIAIGRIALFGIDDTSLSAFQTILLITVLCTLLNSWMVHKRTVLWQRMLILVVAINTANYLKVGFFSLMDPGRFFAVVAPATYPLVMLFSGLFVLILRDFQREHEQQRQLRQTNRELEDQIQISGEKARELERIKSDLEEKAVQLTLSNNFKSEFLANMSHELRTPLNSILILSQLMEENKQGRLAAQDVENARLIYASGRDLLELINDILDLSKVEAGEMKLMSEPVPLSEIPSAMRRSFEAVAARKGVDFTLALEKELPDLIYTDGQRLYQILRNLLSNAFKFTQAGRVSLRVGPADLSRFTYVRPEYEWQYEGIAFEIEDTGIGMTEQQQESIFRAFYQADGAITRKYGGTGLGLSISRSLAELLGGHIQVQSAVGKGSVFTLYLPVGAGTALLEPAQPRDAAAGLQQMVPPHVRGLKSKKILVADDDPRNVRAVTEALAETDMEVLAASNGREALDVLEEHPDIGLVLMDLMMPELDGYETIRRMRADPRYEALPIIVLTAKAMPQDRDKSLEAGATDYLAKPFDVNKFHTVLARYFS